VPNQQYIERLGTVIGRLHKCASTWVESVPVHEVAGGETLWQGVVEVFNLTGHPKAKRVYGWSLEAGRDDQDELFVTLLESPPINSPQSAVRVAMAAEKSGQGGWESQTMIDLKDPSSSI
jgi:hypothetical protein